MTRQSSGVVVMILALFALVFGFWAKESKLEGIKSFAGTDGQAGQVQWGRGGSRRGWGQGRGRGQNWNNNQQRQRRGGNWNQGNQDSASDDE